ncbi:MAG: phage baseplate protein [Candidatus Binatia bacterium]
MAIPAFVSVPQYPSIPSLPGVPAVVRDPLAAAVTIAAPVIQSFLSLFSQTWGVFDDLGNQVLEPDSFMGIEFINAYNISSYPVEKGAFASYNKVNNPFYATVKLAKGGTTVDRAAFLDALSEIAKSLDLYTIVTPEDTYTHVNLEQFDYYREVKDGAGIIIANCRFIEIREAQSEPSLKQAQTGQSPTSSTEINSGQVKPYSDSSIAAAYQGA